MIGQSAVRTASEDMILAVSKIDTADIGAAGQSVVLVVLPATGHPQRFTPSSRAAAQIDALQKMLTR